MWIAGLHEGRKASTSGGAYYAHYCAALASARQNAAGVLVPVLLLGRFGLVNDSQLSPFGRWAASKGVAVFPVARLDFQDDIVRAMPHRGPDHLMGPFLRLHIISIAMRRHLGLLLSQRPDVCGSTVLYTDVDVLFLTPLRATNLVHLINNSSSAAVAYGAESDFTAKSPENTGVMLINVPRFRTLFPKLLAFGRRHNFSFPAYDQGWLNSFFTVIGPAGARVMMDASWNWKVYWGSPQRKQKDLPHIVHFHGPKPSRGAFLACLGSMNVSCLDGLPPQHPYMPLVRQGFRADGGRLAKNALSAHEGFSRSCGEWQPEDVG